MAGRTKSGATRADVARYLGEHPETTISDAARALGVAVGTVWNVKNGVGAAGHEPALEVKNDGETCVVTTRSANIRTLEQALAAAEVDARVWAVDRYVVNSWETTMRTGSATRETTERDEKGRVLGKRKRTTSTPATFTNYQVKVWLTRKVPEPVQDFLDAYIARIGKHAPRLAAAEPKLAAEERYLLELSLYDHHMGLMAWKPETGANWDLKIAERVYANAVADLLRYARVYPIERILFVMGQDFLHINDPTNQTPQNRNPLDVEGRWVKVFETGVRCLRAALEQCRQVAPVEVKWVPGNHDPEISYYVVRVLEEHFRRCRGVTFDTSPKVRKAYSYGPVLLGFAHGGDERGRDLPMVFASEYREEFGKCRHFEIHTGHLHKRREVRLTAADTKDGGVVVRILPGLCAADAWHYRRGWGEKQRAAEAYLWSNLRGYAGNLVVNAREK